MPLASLVFAALLVAAPDDEPVPLRVQRDVEVPMRDGAVLLTDLWLPPEEQLPAPAILVRSPYGRAYEQAFPASWVPQGYAVVVQAVRGRDGNDGDWMPWEHDLEDGHDAVAWVAAQPWCTGRVGMAGGSYLGHTQVLAAASDAPALACIAPFCPGSDGFSDVPFTGGILNLRLIGWLYACRGSMLDLSGEYPSSARDRNLARLPLADIDEAWAGMRSDIWQRWVRVESLADMPDLTVWDRLASAEHVPAGLHVGGLWDHESMATRRNFERFATRGVGHQALVFGPWPHSLDMSTRYADVDYGPDAAVDLMELQARWFARWLRDDDDEDGDADGAPFPRVQVFATGANRWLRLDDWPAADAAPRAFHVTADGLADAPPTDPATHAWTHDPERPSTARDKDFARTTRLWFAHDDPDALVLVTEPFEEPVLLTGPAELELTLASDAVDTDLFALLVEVDRRGRARALQRPSPLRVRFREGADRVVPLEPGTPHRVRWDLGIVAHEFAEGSRLGLALRSEWFPTYARNLGTLEPMATATEGVVQRNVLHAGGGHTSMLRLHEVPRARLDDG